jgi:hypothetical protein
VNERLSQTLAAPAQPLMTRRATRHLALWCVVIAAACGGREVTKPEAVFAKLIGGAMLGSDSTEIVAITAYVPPTTTFRLSDFTVGSSVCCVGMKIAGKSVDAYRLEQFSTEAKTVKVELAFLQAPGVKSISLSYNGAPAGPALKISR